MSERILSANLEYYAIDRKSLAISNAKIYVGLPNTDPTIPANQIDVTVREQNGDVNVIPQPIRTAVGGVPIYNSSTSIQLTVNDDYSIAIYDRDDNQLYYIPKTPPLINGVGQFFRKTADETRAQGLPNPVVDDDMKFNFSSAGGQYQFELVFNILSQSGQPEADFEWELQGPAGTQFAVTGREVLVTTTDIASSKVFDNISTGNAWFSYKYEGWVSSAQAALIEFAWRPQRVVNPGTTATVTLGKGSYIFARRMGDEL